MLKARGFTLVELILAMAIFSLALLVILTGFLALLAFYQNGTQSRIVQTAARNGINAISQAGRQADWFAFNGVKNSVCIEGSPSSIFYLDTTAHQVMEGIWNDQNGCGPTSAISPSAVTTPDAQVADLLSFPADNFLNGGTYAANVPCGVGAPCANSAQAKSLRVTIRVASNINFIDPTHTFCLPSAPAFCALTTLSTTLTVGELTELQ